MRSAILVRYQRQILSFAPVRERAGHNIPSAEAIQTASRGDPDVALVVFQCGRNAVIAEAVPLRKAFDTEARSYSGRA
jgi:hypothetical protein